METGRKFSMSGINSGCWNQTILNFAVLWRPFWKWRPVEIFLCQESFRDIIIYPHMKCRWNRTMLNLCGIVVAILKMETAKMETSRNFSMSGINSGRWNRTMLNLCGIVAAISKMTTGRNFSMSGIISGHHNLPTWNVVEIGQCWICAVLWRTFLKWRPVKKFRCQESFRGIIIYPHMKWRWNRTMLNLCGIVVVILKMATGRNCSMSGINSRHHYLPTYQILMISDNVEYLRYCGSHFENGDR